jgi:hypothetical protein
MEKKRIEVVLDPIRSRFLVDMWLHENQLVVEFEVREQIWTDPPPFLYQDDDDQFTEDPEQSQIYISGAVKSDGCSNMTLNQDGCAQHFCDKREAVRLGELLGRIYDIAAEMMPGHAENLR